MSRDRERAPSHRLENVSAGPARRADNPVLALQQAAGNRAVGQMLARKASSASEHPTIQIGKLAIEVAGGNIAAWAGGDVPDALNVTSQKGPHSAELERMSKERTKVSLLTLTVAAANKSGSGPRPGIARDRDHQRPHQGLRDRRRRGVVAGSRLRRRSPNEEHAPGVVASADTTAAHGRSAKRPGADPGVAVPQLSEFDRRLQRQSWHVTEGG